MEQKVIDLDKIIVDNQVANKETMFYYGKSAMLQKFKDCMKEAIQQALELAAEEATQVGCNCRMQSCTWSDCWQINKESITNIINRVK